MNERDNDITHRPDWIASDTDSADVVPTPANTENYFASSSPHQWYLAVGYRRWGCMGLWSDLGIWLSGIGGGVRKRKKRRRV